MLCADAAVPLTPSCRSSVSPQPRRSCQVLSLDEARPHLSLVPFRSGVRPGTEAVSPGQGCSMQLGTFDSRQASEEAERSLWLLYELQPGSGRCRSVDLHVRLSAWLLPGAEEESPSLAVPGLERRRVPLYRPVSRTARPRMEEVPATELRAGRYVAPLPYAAVREGLARLGLEEAEAFSLAHLYHRRFRVALELCDGEQVLSRDTVEVELYDLGQLGSLYARLLERLVALDAAAQGERFGVEALPDSFHPWYPVLTIGMDKARLYLEAVGNDLERHTTHLPDPRWLMRVGLYLELLTCLGIAEAVRPEYPELLSPEERRALESSPALTAVREQLDVEGWRAVWELRHVARPGLWLRAGPVGGRNLLRKRRTTLAFLETHHEDLKRAMELAGPAQGGTQETWLRVYQDAERAVLFNAWEVFPELRELPPAWAQFALWHACGDFGRWGRVPARLARWVGDQDGVFVSASREYRRSMNEVASWARERGLMEYAGEECIPREASLLF